ncbi:hypothetical protein [Labilibaculum filiforme]|uniref:hypothetical protein n=1 Tax=Labilibaculum filiforme TaxID=1940526 RepID=UPI00117A82E3|nr:hypothetical protein [Labilibaculum filiforme]
MIVYQQQLLKNFTVCLAGDTYVKENNRTYNRTPYLKRAYLQYHNQNLSILTGLLVSEQFKYQRKMWQLRYVSKTFQNKFNYGKNRNVGVLLKHKLSNRFSYDVAISSGYYTPIDDSSKKYQLMAGQTFTTNFCSFRLFNLISLQDHFEHTLAFFISKKLRTSSLGLEVARKNSNNEIADEDQFGFSIFGNCILYKNWMCFARYDMNKESVEPKPNTIIWAGLQYSFKKHLKASLFYKSKDYESNCYGLGIFIH